MNLRNIHTLTKDELSLFNKKYTITFEGKLLVVVAKNTRSTMTLLKNQDTKFTVFAGNRKLTIQPIAIDYWKKYFIKRNTLCDVQNAINTLLIYKQEVNEKSLYDYLSNNK